MPSDSGSGADLSPRLVATATALSLGLAVTATLVLLAAYGFEPQDFGRPASIVGQGQRAADLLRWGGLLDMASYLPFAVLVLHLHRRLQAHGELAAVLTTGGLAYVLIGGIGGALLAAGGPPLIEGFATAGEMGREAARVGLDTLGRMVFVGLFGTLELIPLGIWMAGIGWAQRRQSPRFAALSIFVGVGALASAVRTGLTGRTLVEIDGPLAAAIAIPLGLFIVWQVWVIGRLLRGDRLAVDS